MGDLVIGVRGDATVKVAAENTALTLGSGDVPVFATPVGAAIRAEAELVAVEGRKLTFAVVAHDGRQKIGEGRHQRMRVARDRFLSKLDPA